MKLIAVSLFTAIFISASSHASGTPDACKEVRKFVESAIQDQTELTEHEFKHKSDGSIQKGETQELKFVRNTTSLANNRYPYAVLLEIDVEGGYTVEVKVLTRLKSKNGKCQLKINLSEYMIDPNNYDPNKEEEITAHVHGKALYTFEKDEPNEFQVIKRS